MQASANGEVGEKARRFRRFNIEYPVLVHYRAGETSVEIEAVTKNMSIGGILISSAIVIPLHTTISFKIYLRKDKRTRCIPLAGEGKIVRVERAKNKGKVAMAVECDGSITQLEENLTSFPEKCS